VAPRCPWWSPVAVCTPIIFSGASALLLVPCRLRWWLPFAVGGPLLSSVVPLLCHWWSPVVVHALLSLVVAPLHCWCPPSSPVVSRCRWYPPGVVGTPQRRSRLLAVVQGPQLSFALTRCHWCLPRCQLCPLLPWHLTVVSGPLLLLWARHCEWWSPAIGGGALRLVVPPCMW
jgi:hypothetical protein